MSRHKRLQPILKLAENKVEEVARALGYLNQKIQAEQQVSAQLDHYEEEYLQLMRGGDAPVRKMNVQNVLRYQSFVQRLEQAKVQQQEQIHLLEQQKEQVTQHWIKTRARAQAIASAMAAAQRQEELQASRQEQKALDELVGNHYARR